MDPCTICAKTIRGLNNRRLSIAKIFMVFIYVDAWVTDIIIILFSSWRERLPPASVRSAITTSATPRGTTFPTRAHHAASL